MEIQNIRMRHKTQDESYIVVHPETNGDIVSVKGLDGEDIKLNEVIGKIKNHITSIAKFDLTEESWRDSDEDNGLHIVEITHSLNKNNLVFECFDNNHSPLITHSEIIDSNSVRIVSIDPFTGYMTIREM